MIKGDKRKKELQEKINEISYIFKNSSSEERREAITRQFRIEEEFR